MFVYSVLGQLLQWALAVREVAQLRANPCNKRSAVRLSKFTTKASISCTLRTRCGRARAGLGTSEFTAAFDKARREHPDASPQKLENAVLDQIDLRREKIIGISPLPGVARLLTADKWKEIHAKAEDDARRELLSGSSDLQLADELEAKAKVARNQSDAKNAELLSALDEFVELPHRASDLEARFTRIANERALLDLEAARASYRGLYRHAFEHPTQNYSGQEFLLTSLLVTSELRGEVLDALEAETKSKLEALKKRNIELAKKLGRAAHKI